MLIFDDKQRYHSMLFMPDPKASEENQNEERLGEYFRNFRDVAVAHERTGNGRDSLFIVSEADNAENYRLLVSPSVFVIYLKFTTIGLLQLRGR